MNKIHQEGYFLPVKQTLIDLLFKEMGNPPPYKTRISSVSLLFKDLTYSAERGGYHPVEIRLISRNGEWHFDYITDFSYMGTVYPELEKEIDISWSQQYVFLAHVGDLPVNAGKELFELWQSNFIQYHAMNAYTITVLWES
ncbi:DUF2787 domain-containing protein [Pectobacterium versatile]|uniref:DUF2787 family protein n=1 Tax=Pectobacterium brasiliense TaxID=180957 RepID=A0AAE2WER4_9GAMM|nr:MULTISPECIES: DUF2787 family protein [Pectobacterium]MBN3051736.1 DUF2787 family protein [Pectobacterium brasiliense]MBQ4780755.1 DUF2787 domain-containing protein [Pectobacterium versatile]MBQ4785232.1 DUF2787 domain-containing protein [Pectobacterium versatile]TAJ06142.1 DUF2787 domain-containing protein [Pectobacterium versatile]